MKKLCSWCILIGAACSSCATSYKPLTPVLYPYRNKDDDNRVVKISYDYDVQLMSGNKRYSNSEKKNHMAAVAIRIENNSDHVIRITRDNLLIFKGDNQIMPLSPMEYSKKVKQKAGFHMFHALWGPWAYSYQNNNGQKESHFIYLPVGAIVGIANSVKGSKANALHLATLQSNEIWKKEILPGEKAHGVILIQALGFEELRFELID